MEIRNYFERPKQVVFADPDNPGQWLVGIAFRDEIICSCCGGVFEIADVCQMAEEDGVKTPIYIYEDWTDITDEIAGDALPVGLEYNRAEGKIVEVDCNKTEEVEDVDYDAFYFVLEEPDSELT